MPILRQNDLSQERAAKPHVAEQPSVESPADESLAGKLNREFGLLAQLPGGAVAAIQERLNHPVDLAVQLGVATAVGIGVIAMSKNPALLGEAAAPYVSKLLFGVEKLSAPAIAVDWTNRFAAPMLSTWDSASNDASARLALSQNVGGGLVDYSTGLMGFRFSGKMAQYIEAPAFAAAKIDAENIINAAKRVEMLGESPVLALKSLKTSNYSQIMRDKAFDMLRIRSFSAAMTGEGLTNYYKSTNRDLGSDLFSVLKSDSKKL